MTYSKKIDQKIKHRENLIKEYTTELQTATANATKILEKKNIAVDTGDFKAAVKLEREYADSLQAIEELSRAIEIANESLKLSPDEIKAEFKIVTDEHTARINKLKDEADKLLKPFVSALQKITALQQEGNVTARQWDNLLKVETSAQNQMPILTIGGVVTVKKLFTDYENKLNIK
jgi:hypothetical protein